MIDYWELKREMDRQHDALNRMLDNMEKDQDQHSRKEAVTDALNAMSEYALKHFKLEERAMTETNYPGFDQHREKHRQFLVVRPRCSFQIELPMLS